MRTSIRFGAAALLLALSASMAFAQGSGKNDSVDYTPRVYTVAGTLPVDQSYTLAVSAPTQLNDRGQAALVNGLVATLRVNVASYPEGSSQAEAAALVSLDDLSMVFYALGETHQTIVRVAASINTTPGDFMYNIQAVGPSGLGWGIASHTLTVTVSQPVVLDTTPPDVRITSPTDKQGFTFCSAGTKVPVTISAVDAESVVTAVGGTVNGTSFAVQPFTPANAVSTSGEFVAPAVGAYTLGAWATSAGGTGTAPEVGISVNYVMSWLPPLSAGRTIRGAVPIKFAAYDCEGAFVADTSVRVEVWEASNLRFTAVYGDGSDAVRIETGTQYITNFHPPSGNHTYTVKVFFNNYLQATTTFAVQ
jgi:hypothetical protein